MYWLGPDYQEAGVPGNDIRRTNVPAIRIAYRYEALTEELRLLGNAYKSRQEVKKRISEKNILKKFIYFSSVLTKIDVYIKSKQRNHHH